MGKARLHYYACGQTRHELSQVFSGHEKESRVFPSGVFLFEHKSGERVLFDTGYAPSMEGTGISGRLYAKLLPPEVTADATINRQLENDGIDPLTIGRVVLSHLHPDHIGGVRYFPNAEFIVSTGMLNGLERSRLKDGVFRALLPSWFSNAVITNIDQQEQVETTGGYRGYDVFHDGSYVVVELPGHARGHLGAFVLSRTLLAGDAAWGNDLLESTGSMRAIPRYINHNIAEYERTARQLITLRDKHDVQLYFSHDTYESAELSI